MGVSLACRSWPNIECMIGITFLFPRDPEQCKVVVDSNLLVRVVFSKFI